VCCAMSTPVRYQGFGPPPGVRQGWGEGEAGVGRGWGGVETGVRQGSGVRVGDSVVRPRVIRSSVSALQARVSSSGTQGDRECVAPKCELWV
jgi:hypothetical protein